MRLEVGGRVQKELEVGVVGGVGAKYYQNILCARMNSQRKYL